MAVQAAQGFRIWFVKRKGPFNPAVHGARADAVNQADFSDLESPHNPIARHPQLPAIRWTWSTTMMIHGVSSISRERLCHKSNAVSPERLSA